MNQDINNVTNNVTQSANTNNVINNANQIKEKIAEQNTLNKTDKPIIEANENITNPQKSINEVASSTSNVYNNDEHIIISKTSDVKAGKHSVVIAKIENNAPVMINNEFPPSVDINKKEEVKVNKKGKKIKVVTLKERITNFILTIFLLAAIGAGGYYGYNYLYQFNPANFVAKNVEFELGSEIPTTSQYYINLQNISEPEYILDISEAQEADFQVGTYTYSVKYGNVMKKASMTIKDTKGPELKIKNILEFELNRSITKEDLILSCFDYSNCDYDLKEPVDTSTNGDKSVIVVAQDKYNNKTEKELQIHINNLIYSMTCTKTSMSKFLSYNINEEYILKYNENYKLLSIEKTTTNKYINDHYFESDRKIYKDNSDYIIDEFNKIIVKKETAENINGLTEYSAVRENFQTNGYTCQ